MLLSAKGSTEPRLYCVNDDCCVEFEIGSSSQISPLEGGRISGRGSYEGSPTGTPLPSKGGVRGGVSSFLYEPNASLMKAGLFDELASRYEVTPLARNSHLFTSEERVAGFPGRTFQITAVSSMNKRDLREKVFPLKRVNISVRNFPMSVAELRKRLKLNEGGSNYLFATTLANGEHVLIICQHS